MNLSSLLPNETFIFSYFKPIFISGDSEVKLHKLIIQSIFKNFKLNISNFKTTLKAFSILLFANIVFVNLVSARDFIEGKFDNNLQTKTLVLTSYPTTYSAEKVTVRHTSFPYNYHIKTYVNNIKIQDQNGYGKTRTNTDYGYWTFTHTTNHPCFAGVSYKCFDVYFHPNVAAFNSIPNGTTVRLENIFRQNNRNQTGTTTLIVSRDNSINFNWRNSFNGEDSNPSDNYDSFEWRYANITANLNDVSNLNFQLKIKDGLNSIETITLAKGEHNSSWLGEEWYHRSRYGEWIIRSFSNCPTGSGKCSQLLIKQNRTMMNRLYGRNVKMELVVRNPNDVLNNFEYKIIGRPKSNFAWHTPGSGNLVTGNLSEYANIVGKGSVFSHSQSGVTFKVSEKITEQAAEIDGNRTNVVKSNKRQYGSNLTYGSWWIDDAHSNQLTDSIDDDYFRAEYGFYFEPNSDAIHQNLQIGQTATSTLKLNFHVGNDSSAVDRTDEIIVTITRLPIVSISVDKTILKEGEDFTYTLTVDPAPTPTKPFNVYLEESEVNDPNGTPNTFDGSDLVTKVVTAATSLTTKTTQLRSNLFPDGTYTISISSHSTYLIKGANPVAVNIENVAPSEISITTDATSITEGGTFDFTLTATPAPKASIPISLTTNDANSGYFGSYSVSNIEIPTSGSLDVTASTNVLASITPTTALTISIDTSSSYVKSTTAGSISVNIENSNRLVMSITSDATAITEGGTFDFTLTATPAPTTAIQILLTANDANSGYFGSYSVTDIVIPTTGSLDVTVTTNFKASHDPTSALTISIDASSSYAIASNARSISVNIENNNQHTIAITTNTTTITEGETFDFTLTATPTPTSAIPISLTANDANSGYFGTYSVTDIKIPTTGSLDVTVATNFKASHDPTTTLSIAIDTNSSYIKSTTTGSISVNIDNKNQHTISITTNTTSFTEGGTFDFTLTATPAPTASIPISLTADDANSGYFGSYSQSNIEIPTSGRLDVTASTNILASSAPTTTLTISIDTSSTYIKSTTAGSISVNIENSNQQVISITSDATAITEGGTFDFTLTANPAPTTAIPISLTANDTNSGYFRSYSVANIEIPTTGSLDVTVATNFKPTHDPIAALIISINANSSYAIATNAESISVNIENNNQHTISITTNTTAITEGETFDFALTATPAPSASIPISLTANDANSGYFGSYSVSNFEIPTSGSLDVTASTNILASSAPTTALTISINTSSSYINSTTAGSISVNIENSNQQVISITSDATAITEGGTFDFTLAANPAPTTAIPISLTANDANSGYFGSYSVANIEIPTTGSLDVTVATNFKPTHDPIAALIISINANSSYAIATNAESISVNIENNNQHVISITTDTTSITEGGTFDFTLTATPAPVTTIPISLTANDANSGYFSSYSISNIEIPTSGSLNVTVATNFKSTHDPIAALSIAIDTSSSYIKSTTAGSISVNIENNNQHTISITTDTASITEGGTFDFTLTATPAPATAIPISLTANDANSGYFKSYSVSNIEIPTTGSLDVTVATNFKSTHDPIAALSIAIDTSSSYIKSTTAGSISVNIENNNQHTISITTNTASITEGGTFDFTLTATPAPTASIPISLTANDANSGYFGSYSVSNIEIPTSGSLNVTVATNFKSTHDPIAVLSIAIDASSSYIKSTTAGSISVNIENNHQHVISITTNTTAITEGEIFDFTLTATPAPTTTIPISLTENDANSGYFGSYSISNIEIPTTGSLDVTVATNFKASHDLTTALSIAIDASSSYIKSTSAGSISVNIENNHQHVISITTNTTTITEGETFDFTLTATPTPTTAIPISLTENDANSGYFGSYSVSNIEIPTSGSLAVTVATNFKASHDLTTALSIAIDASSSYIKSTSAGSISVNIENNDQHVISITTDTTSITEGGTFDFTLTATPAPTTTIPISLTANDANSGYFGSYSVSNIEIPTSGSLNVTVATNFKASHDPTSALTISIDANSSYIKSTSAGSISVNIENNHQHVISITTNTTAITEGETFDFTLTATPAPSASIPISLTTNDENSGYFGSYSVLNIEIPTSGSLSVTVATNFKASHDSTTALSIAIDASSSYIKSTSAGSISVNIENNHQHVISITTNSTAVTEGETFDFTLTATPAPSASIPISLTTNDANSGYFGSYSVSNIEIPTSGSLNVTVATNFKASHDPTSALTISIDANSSYIKSTSAGSISVNIENNHQHVISITTNTTAITEGETFDFTLTATPAPSASIPISLTTNDENSGYFGSYSVLNIEIPTSGSLDVTVATNFKASHDLTTALSITIDTSSSYIKSTSAGSISVNIENNNQHVISITTNTTTITEGETFDFTLTATPAPTASIPISLTANDANSGYFGSYSVSNIEIPTSGSLNVTVATNFKSTHDPIAVLSIAIDASSSYIKSTSTGSISVNIDNNNQHTISITTDTTSITEGGTFDFTLTATPAPATAIPISLTANDANSGYFGSYSALNIEIPTTGSLDITVATNFKASHDPTTALSIAINASSTYIKSTSTGSISVNIENNNLHVISITTDTTSITEGGTFDFTLTATPAPTTAIPISLAVNDENSGYFGSYSVSNIEIPTSGSLGITVATNFKASHDPTTALSITIDASSSYIKSTSAGSISVNIENNHLHVNSITTNTKHVISITTNTVAVTEGNTFDFTLTATPAPTTAIPISLAVNDANSGYFGSYSVSNIEIPTSGSLGVTVATNFKASHDPITALIISIDPSSSYIKSTSTGSISVNIENNNLHVISITTNTTTITEGETFDFKLTATPALATAIPISLTENDANSGYFGSYSVSNIEIPTSGSLNVTVATNFKASHDPTTALSIAIDASSSYIKSTSTGSISVNIENNHQHIISITTNSTTITEGDTFDFTLTATPAPATAIPISLTANDANSGYFGSYSVLNIEIPTSGSLNVTVATNFKASHDPTVALGIAIDTSSSYIKSTVAGSIFVNIENNDLHLISISSSAHDNSIVEGTSFNFTLEATPPPPQDLEVTITADSNPDEYLVPGLNLTVNIGTSGLVEVSVATNELSDVTEIGQLVIGIAEQPTLYLVSSEKSSITVSISKISKPTLSRVSITSIANGESVVEGNEFKFQLTAEPAPATDLEVSLTIVHADFFDPAPFDSVTIPTTGSIEKNDTNE